MTVLTTPGGACPWNDVAARFAFSFQFAHRQTRVAQKSRKGPFIATQLNSTRRRGELSCVAINEP